jgi:ankyrin repeat protein
MPSINDLPVELISEIVDWYVISSGPGRRMKELFTPRLVCRKFAHQQRHCPRFKMLILPLFVGLFDQEFIRSIARYKLVEVAPTRGSKDFPHDLSVKLLHSLARQQNGSASSDFLRAIHQTADCYHAILQELPESVTTNRDAVLKLVCDAAIAHLTNPRFAYHASFANPDIRPLKLPPIEETGVLPCAFVVAAHAGFDSMLNHMLSKSDPHLPDPNISTRYWGSALYAAIRSNNISTVDLLLSKKADPNLVGDPFYGPRNHNDTPLATAFDSPKIIHLLIDPTIPIPLDTSSDGTLAALRSTLTLQYAHSEECAKILYEHLRHLVPRNGPELVYCAASGSKNEILIDLLNTFQVDPNSTGYMPSRNSPLQAATGAGNIDGIRILLEHGATLNGRANDPYRLAVALNNIDAIRVFATYIKDGKNVCDINAFRYRHLFVEACERAQIKVAKAMVDLGFKPCAYAVPEDDEGHLIHGNSAMLDQQLRQEGTYAQQALFSAVTWKSVYDQNIYAVVEWLKRDILPLCPVPVDEARIKGDAEARASDEYNPVDYWRHPHDLPPPVDAYLMEAARAEDERMVNLLLDLGSDGEATAQFWEPGGLGLMGVDTAEWCHYINSNAVVFLRSVLKRRNA